MGKKNEVFPEREPFADLSAAPIQSLCKRKGFSEFLDALVKRVPPFSTISLGWRVHVPIGQSAGLPPWKQTELILNLGYKAGTFKRFGEREGAYDLFSKFFGARYFDKLQRCYECALSLEAGRISGRLQCRLAEQLSPVDYESQIEDLRQQIFADCIWPPVQFLLDVFNEIAIRFIGNGTPLRFYDHVIRWNTQRIGGEREGREFVRRLGRALEKPPKEMFDKDSAIMLFSADEMSCGIPPLPRWRDQAGLDCVRLACGDHSFSMDAYRGRFPKLGLRPEKSKLVKGSLNGEALVIKWAKPVRNLVKSSTIKN